jgi:hypothetical protein
MERSFIRLTNGQLLNLRDVKIIEKSDIKILEEGFTKEKFTISYSFDVEWNSYVREIFETEEKRDKKFDALFDGLYSVGVNNSLIN